MKSGAVLIRRRIENAQSASGVGSFSFNTRPTGFALANFLQGTVYQVSRILQLSPRYLRTWEPSFYAQDDWRLTPRLTLNLGLRYDIFTPVTDAHGHISNFDPATASLIVPGINGGSDTAGVQTDYRSIAPRFGFAFNLQPGTVFRGGYGLVFFRDNTGPSVPFANPPYVTTYSPNPLTTTLSTPLPYPTAQSISSLSGALRGIQLDYRNSYVQQLNFNVEQAFGGTVLTVGYIGSLGRRLRISPDLNLAPPGTVSYVTRRPYYSVFPDVTSLPNIQSNGFNNYHGLQVSVQRRLSRGITANANYTWSHTIGDTVGFSQGGLYTSVFPSQTGKLERGNSDLDVRHRFTLMLTYALPIGQSLTGWKGGLINGWQINAIDVWQTGFPFSVVNASPQSNTGIGSDRPNQIADATLDHPTVQQWFNRLAFQPQAFGTVGSAARNSVYGPHFRHFDLSLLKDFQLTEHLKLQARAESYNFTNTPNFGQPSASLGNASFAAISSTRTGSTPRLLQFALRLSF